jgi:L,D-transpeptidase catalytic domain
MKRHLKKLSAVAVAGLMCLPFSFAQAAETHNYLQLSYNLSYNTNLSPKAIEMALAGHQWALKNATVRNKDILTIVDFTLPSNENRLYVIDLTNGKIVVALPVTHGKNSGNNSRWTTSFSNTHNSLQSSIGVFLTEGTYYGQHGFSLRIKGLEKSNNNAYTRNVVVHPANYASASYIKQNGRAGTSWGCFAVDPNESKKLIEYIKGGSVLYAYGKSSQYMASTQILADKNSA